MNPPAVLLRDRWFIGILLTFTTLHSVYLDESKKLCVYNAALLTISVLHTVEWRFTCVYNAALLTIPVLHTTEWRFTCVHVYNATL